MTTILSLTDTKIDGVGDASLKKLLDGGITTVNALSVLTTLELIEYTGLGVGTAEKAIAHARELMGAGFHTGEEILEIKKNQLKHSTGSPMLDKCLNGGIHSGAITEFIGEFGALKTQLCKTAAVICAATYGTVIVFDTEGIWMNNIHRLKQIASERGYNPEEVIKNIIIARTFNTEHFAILIKQLFKKVDDENAKMVIVDSIIGHFRSEFKGRGTLADRQQTMGGDVGRLLRLAEAYNIPILFTNQVQSDPSGNVYADPNKPTGGHVLGHACNYRLMLRKGRTVKGDTMDYQTVLISSYDCASITPFKIRIMCTEAGIVDEDGSFGGEDDE